MHTSAVMLRCLTFELSRHRRRGSWTASAKSAVGRAIDGRFAMLLGLGLNEGLGVTEFERCDSMPCEYAITQSFSCQTYDILAVAGNKPGAAGKTHLLRVSRASESNDLFPRLSPLDLIIAVRVTFPSAFTSNSNVVVPVASLRRASAG